MNIQDHIAGFLHSNERLLLPGLGTLKKIRTGAGINNSKLSPPASVLVFSAEESYDDADHFPSYIAAQENISREEALQQILEYIDTIKFAFNKGEDFEISGLGIFRIDQDNKISFEQDPSFIPDPENYGLEPFEIKKPEETEKVEKEKPPKRDEERTWDKFGWVLDDTDMHKFEETYVTGSARKTAETDKDQVQEENSTKNGIPDPPPPPPGPLVGFSGSDSGTKKRRKLNIGLTIAGVIIVLLTVVYLVSPDQGFFGSDINFDDIFGSSEEMEINDDFSNVKDEDFDFDEMVGDLEKDIDSSAAIENALDIQEKQGSREQGAEGESGEYIEYHIIAGSFRDYENAKDLQQELTLQGYPSLIIEPGNGVFRVSAISFREKVTALNELVEFREKTGLTGAWLMNLE